MTELEALGERCSSSEEIFNGVILHVRRDTVTLPNGHTAGREVIRHIGAVCVVPVNDRGEVILERQFRYPLNQVITEIPAGKLDSFDEDRLEAARRELREETGFTAAHWTDMGLYYPAAAYSDEKITMYLATGLTAGEQSPDDDEFLNVFTLPLEDAVSQILSGEITDGKTQVAILKAAALLKK